MNRLFMMSVVVLMISGILVAQRAGPETAAITGSVQKLDSTDAIGGAFVELRATSRVPPLIVAADEAGRFAFREVPPGEYTLAATHPGYVRTEFGQRKLNGPGVRIALNARQQLNALVLSLTPTATISGQIRGPKGLPAAHIQVHALKYGYEDGRRVLQTVRSVRTNDEGDYRLYWLPPGQYIVMGVPLLGALENRLIIPGPDGTARGFRPVQVAAGVPIVLPGETGSIPFYHPGAVRLDSALSITLKPGEDRSRTDFNLMSLSLLRVRGVVGNLPPANGGTAQWGPAAASVRLESTTPSVLDRRTAPGYRGSVDLRTGAFDIRGVMPGSYNLIATAWSGGRSSTATFARVPLEVAGSDIDNLRVTLAPSLTMTVRVQVEGAADNAAEIRKLLPLRVGLNEYPAEPEPSQPGIFVAQNLPPNVYQVRVDPLPNGYVKSARYGDVDVLETGASLSGTPTDPLDITVSLAAGVVTGTVVDDAAKPVANAAVVLVPDAARQKRPSLYKNVVSGADGNFRISGIAPGDYTLYSWVDVETGAWQDRAFLKDYEEKGKPIHIAESSTAKVEVIAIP